MTERAYIGLGANLADPLAQVAAALRELARWGPLRASSLYRTEPLGDPRQPWYINAVAELTLGPPPMELLRSLKRLERRAGRPAGAARWAPRILDLDLLLYGNRRIQAPELQVPHPRFHQRRFVLEPLVELAPELRDPRNGRTVRELLAALDDPLRVEKLPHRRPALAPWEPPLEVQQR